MTDVKNLTTELSSIDEQLAVLRAKRAALSNELHEITKRNIAEEFAAWNIKEGDCLLLFNKDMYDFSLIKTIIVSKINEDIQYVSYIEGYYTSEYDDCSYRVSMEHSSFTTLLNFKKNYNIYVTDATMLNVLHSHLCSLLVNSSNIKEYEKSFENSSDRVI